MGFLPYGASIEWSRQTEITPLLVLPLPTSPSSPNSIQLPVPRRYSLLAEFTLTVASYGRQPIGGEFSFSREFIKYCRSKKVSSEAKQYGIDIFLTTHAVGGGFKTGEVLLGRKFHKPSFPKIVPMFKQVYSSAIKTLLDYPINKNINRSINDQKTICIDDNNTFKHRDKVNDLLDYSKRQITKNEQLYKDIGFTNFSLFSKQINSGQSITSKDWGNILSDFFVIFMKSNDKNAALSAELISPLFFLRTISFWFEVLNETPIVVEKKLEDQAELIRKLTWDKIRTHK